MLRGLTIVGSVGFPVRCWPELMDAVVRGAPDRSGPDRAGDDGGAVADGFERLLDPGGDAIKILIEVGRGA